MPILIAAAVLAPSVTRANPAIVNPVSLLAFCIVAFWAMVVEAGVVALLLAWRGAAAFPLFVAYFILNGAVFLFLFHPLLGSISLPLPVLEAGAVLVDGAVIKLLVAFDSFQADGYRGVSWLRSLITSCIGNTLSYLVGEISAATPWVISS